MSEQLNWYIKQYVKKHAYQPITKHYQWSSSMIQVHRIKNLNVQLEAELWQGRIPNMQWKVDILYIIAELKTEWHCVSSRSEGSNRCKECVLKESNEIVNKSLKFEMEP